MINLSSFIAFHAWRAPARCALKYRGEDITYAAFDHRIRQVAGWPVTPGIGSDDVVAVLMKNSTAFLELAFASSYIGAVFFADQLSPLCGRGRIHRKQFWRAASDRRRGAYRHRGGRRANRAARRGCAGDVDRGHGHGGGKPATRQELDRCSGSDRSNQLPLMTSWRRRASRREHFIFISRT
jgi:AMP-binding enzyme